MCILFKLLLTLVAGLGFGIMSGLFAMVNILADISGPGTLGLNGEDQNFALVSGMWDVLFNLTLFVIRFTAISLDLVRREPIL